MKEIRTCSVLHSVQRSHLCLGCVCLRLLGSDKVKMLCLEAALPLRMLHWNPLALQRSCRSFVAHSVIELPSSWREQRVDAQQLPADAFSCSVIAPFCLLCTDCPDILHCLWGHCVPDHHCGCSVPQQDHTLQCPGDGDCDSRHHQPCGHPHLG